ncbi:MAG: hypothetical protein ACXABY_13505 [Candidatus Thorarchaeota archaeon]|jgi:hypothetical protein
MKRSKAEKILSTIAEGEYVAPVDEFFRVSPDNRHIASFRVLEPDRDHGYAMLDQSRHRKFDDFGKLVFSPDSQRLAYFAGFDGKAFVVIDGKEYGPYDNAIEDSLIFSPNSQHVTFAIVIDSSHLVIIDGESHGPYDGVTKNTPVYSPNSERVAWGVYETNRWFVMVDGNRQGPYDGVGKLVFSPDSSHLGYKAQEGSSEFLVINGERQDAFDQVDNPYFGPDGSRLAFAARRGHEWFAVVDGDLEGPYDGAFFHPWSFSPSKNRISYVTTRGQDWFVFTDGVEAGPYDEIHTESPCWSTSGDRFGYLVAVKKKKLGITYREEWKAVIDGIEGSVYSAINNIVFSPNGRRVAYLANRGKAIYVVVDGQESSQFSNTRGELVFSPDSARLAYSMMVKKNSDEYVIVEQEQFGPYQKTGHLSFSPDGRRLAYITVVQDNETVVVDGVKGDLYDAIVIQGGGTVVFDSPTAFHYIAKRGKEFYLVEETIE